MRALGLMSGTSLDGIDAALVEIRPRGCGYELSLVRAATAPFSRELRERLLAALPPERVTVAEAAALDRLLGRAFSDAARTVAGEDALDYCATHGLTIHHDGQARATMQIGEPYALRDALAATVVFDFRRADCSAGGEGAPLVPYVDALLFPKGEGVTIVLNLGGIANATFLSPDGVAEAACDLGPANVLLDALVRERTSGAESFDRDGERAARGSVDEALLSELLEDAFFRRTGPKSTGREQFGAHYLAAHRARLDRLSFDDACATLAAFSAEAIARGTRHLVAGRAIVSGGGVHNRGLMAHLRKRVAPGIEIVRSDAAGVDPDFKEALAFAVLGYETLRGRPAGVPAATGAAHAAVLGAIVPFALSQLLAKVEREIAESVTR